MTNARTLKTTKFLIALTLCAPCLAFAQIIDDLPTLLFNVFENHPTLKAKKSEFNATRHGVTVAERQFWPTPSIANEVGPTDLQGLSNATTARLTYPVFTGGQLAADLEIADLRQRIATSEIEITGIELLLQFVDLYRTWWFHSARIERFKVSLAQMNQLRQMLTRRTLAGVSANLDLAQAELQWQRMQDDSRQAIKLRDQVLEDMVTFVGKKIQPQFHPLAYWQKSPYAQISELTERVLATHPSTKLSAWQTTLAKTELKKAKSGLMPNVSLRLEKQYGSYQGALAPGSRIYLNSQFTLGAGLAAFPMQEQASERANTAELQGNAARLSLSMQVQRAWHERAQAEDQITNITQQLKAQNELSESGERLFAAGRRSWQDILNLQRELYQLQAQQSEAEAAYLGADWRLHLLANTLPKFSLPTF
jgi:adhesin transport system outer membrane protein